MLPQSFLQAVTIQSSGTALRKLLHAQNQKQTKIMADCVQKEMKIFLKTTTQASKAKSTWRQ